MLRNSFGWLFGVKSRSPLSKPCVWKKSVFKNRYRPIVEALEDRVVPSIVFSNSGSRTVADGGGNIIQHPHVDLVFWGAGWNTGSGPALRTQMNNAVNTIMDSYYLTDGNRGDALSQYRGIGNGSHISSQTITSTNPPNPFSDSQVDTMLQNNISSGAISDFRTDNQILYIVIPQPGTVNVDPSAGGAHNSDRLGFLGPRFHYGWTINRNGETVDFLTKVYSHELVEASTDPEYNFPNGTAFWVPSTNDEIGDGEAQNYSAIVNGILVQSFLSQNRHAYIVPTGQQQDFFVSSDRVLTVNGDQLASHNDTITVYAVGDGVLITLNGEFAQFPAGAINSVVVNSGSGDDTITIGRTPAGVPVTVNLGTGHDTVTVGAPSLINASTVTINAPAGSQATLIVDDHGTPTSETYTVTDSSVSRTSGGVGTINYSNIQNLKVYVGTATEVVNVPSTAAGTTTIILGGSGNDTINIGAPGLFNHGPTLVDGQVGHCVLNINDQPDALAQTYQITSTAVTRTGEANSISYSHIANLALSVGYGTEVVNVPSTAAGTTTSIFCGSGFDTVNVSPSAHNLDAIQGPLTINGGAGVDFLNLFDQAKQFTMFPGTYAVSATFVGRTGAAAITYNHMVQLVLDTAAASPFPIMIDVTGTASGTVTNVNAQTGPPNYFTVGDAGNTLNGIQGPLFLSSASFSQLSVNDQGSSSGGTYTVTGASISRSGSAGISFQGLYAVYLNGGTGANAFTVASTPTVGITLGTGTGIDTVNVQGTSGPLAISAQGGGGNDVVNLGLNDSLGSINGAVTISNGGNPVRLNVNDSADNANRAVVIGSGGITGMAPAPLNFTSSSVNTLVINGGGGNNSYTVAQTPASAGVTLNPGTGIDAVTEQRSSALLTVNSASGSGADTISLGDVNNILDFLTGDMRLNAAATDTLVLNDQGRTRARDYGVIPTVVFWDGHEVAFSGLASVTVNGSAGGNTFDLSRGTPASAAMILNGGGGSNRIVGSNAGNSWEITGADAGALTGAAYPHVVSFNQVGNLAAGTGGDYFLFDDGASLSGNIAGPGGETLGYTPYTSSVIVDLQTGSATGVAGSVNGIASVVGGSGAPASSGVYNLLIGNGGNTLTAGTGRRNILVAGASASTLIGGDQDDLLIAGTTAYDTDPALAAWLQIASYWAGNDDFGTRADNLANGNGVPLLDASVVTGNGGGNTLTGNGELGLIYTDGLDNISGFDPGSRVVPINP
jgi:hypothetical protein